MNNETKTCYYCGQVKETQNGVQWGRYFYCDNCFKEVKCRVNGYHEPMIETRFKNTSEDDENEKLYFGFELETSKNVNETFYQSEHTEDVFYIRKNFKDLDLNFERDGSIGNGMEIISQPMTYKYIKANENKLKDIFEHLQSTGNFSHDKGKCGLHIHVSKEALGESEDEILKTIEKLMLFVETYRDKVEKFSRRRHNEFSHYNSYTIPTHKYNHSSETCFTDENFYKSGKILMELNRENCIGHSSVVNVNTSTGKTIEFRMFRGTLKFETFMATLEFMNNLVHVCKENQASKISWNKVIQYGGDYIKAYNESLNLIDDGMYLRDYTTQIEGVIDRCKATQKEVLDNYKKDLEDISGMLQDIINAPIDFNKPNDEIKRTIDFRNHIFSKIKDVLIDGNVDNQTTLYKKLLTMNKDFTQECKNNLKSINKALSDYVLYGLDETLNNRIVETMTKIKEKLTTNATSTQGEC